MPEPQEGGGAHNKGEIRVTPEQYDVYTTAWTNGTASVTVEVRSQVGVYKIGFTDLQFLTFTNRCMQEVSNLIRDKRKGK